MRHLLYSLVLCLIASGCSPTIQTRGVDSDMLGADKIQVGVHDKNEVIKLLGSPSSVGSLGQENTWYYVSKQQYQDAFFKPRDVKFKILTIIFNEKDIVQDVSYDEDKETPQINPDLTKQTPSTGHETGIAREIFSNFGRMGTKKPTRTRA